MHSLLQGDLSRVSQLLTRLKKRPRRTA
jgi:hypothetical protein